MKYIIPNLAKEYKKTAGTDNEEKFKRFNSFDTIKKHTEKKLLNIPDYETIIIKKNNQQKEYTLSERAIFNYCKLSSIKWNKKELSQIESDLEIAINKGEIEKPNKIGTLYIGKQYQYRITSTIIKTIKEYIPQK